MAGDALVCNVLAEAAYGGSGYVCVANVHQVTEAWRSETFRRTLRDARWVSTDSRVLELVLSMLGHPYPSDVTYGVDILEGICAGASASGITVGLFGGTPHVVAELTRLLAERYPRLQLRFVLSPGFGTAAELADDTTVDLINLAGVDVLLVGLGCPKQETWMQLVSTKVHCLMVGVGAAFDFYAGAKTSSPSWLRHAGLDWLWRLASEPRRLWRRYFVGNSIFLARILPVIVAHWLRIGRGMAIAQVPATPNHSRHDRLRRDI